MSGDLQILRELTEIARTAGAMGGGKGRYARTPDFSAPAHPSSRPRSDRGVTFHFSHKTISKSRDISENNHSQTTSAAHQGYIERPSATERATPEVTEALHATGGERGAEHPLSTGFDYPERSVDPSRISFGTLGTTKADRKDFWQKVEASEARRSRVQSRIIAELPAELDAPARARAARDFCEQTFEDRCLPYWATLHAPTAKNDSRNYHLHITYFDRPSGRDDEGRWDFSVRETRIRAKSRKYTVRPYRNDKHPDTRAIGWPREMRTDYADILNEHLSIANVSKRHDPRSYRDSGIAKEPTEHLGNKCSAFESFGIETEPGKRNARREIRWRFIEAEQPWVDRAKLVESSPVLADPEMSDLKTKLFEIASDGITTARRSTSHLITAELLSHRVGKRDAFLEEELLRITKKDDVSTLGQDSQTMIALQSEAMLIDDRRERIASLEAKCRSSGTRLGKAAEKMKQDFDRMAAGIDAEELFVEDMDQGFEPIDAMIDDPVVDEQDDPFMESKDLEDISDLLEDLAPEEPTEEPREEADALTSSAINEEGTEHGYPPEVTAEPAQAGTRTRDPIEAIISRIASTEDLEDSPAEASQPDAEDFPGAMPIRRPSDPQDVSRLDEKLLELDNRSLRLTAIASRDATDICPAGQMREDLNRGWVVLRFEAERRGLDLDTGIHDPSKAKDPERAEVHRDQEPCPLRVIRKDLARQRVRT